MFIVDQPNRLLGGVKGSAPARVPFFLPWPGWWNWQTRRPQKALLERACGFESHTRHALSVRPGTLRHVHPDRVRLRAFDLLDAGWTIAEVSRSLGHEVQSRPSRRWRCSTGVVRPRRAASTHLGSPSSALRRTRRWIAPGVRRTARAVVPRRRLHLSAITHAGCVWHSHVLHCDGRLVDARTGVDIADARSPTHRSREASSPHCRSVCRCRRSATCQLEALAMPLSAARPGPKA